MSINISVNFKSNMPDFSVSTDEVDVKHVGIDYYFHPDYLFIFVLFDNGDKKNYVFKNEDVLFVCSYMGADDSIEDQDEDGGDSNIFKFPGNGEIN